MNFKCILDLAESLKTEFPGCDLPKDWAIEVELCPAGQDGDITVNCFRFARFFKAKPDLIAEKVFSFLSDHADVLDVTQIKAFVNLKLKPEAIHLETVAKCNKILTDDILADDEKEKILIEYSAPNTNKPQHLGHVRNNTLGMSLASLLKRVGHDVNPVNLVNDRGIHICKSMIAYQRFGNGATPESTGKKGDHLVGYFYVLYNDELKKQIKELRDANSEALEAKTDDELFLETEIGKATQKMLLDWEAGEPEVRELWKMMNSWVFAGFDQTYKRMGVEFEKTYLESETYLLGKDIIEAGLSKGVFKKRDDGAVIVDLGKKLGEKVVLRSDGTSVYITQDIGTTVMKYEEFKADKQIWVVGDEQIHHFKQLFATLKALGHSWADGLHHLAYGMVNLPTGKMKSREGTVVDADDLFDEMVGLAKKATLERCGDDVPKDIDQRSEIIGMGALKFMLLKFNPKTTIMFDPQASLKFEGDTGPYVQYVCARINSIKSKGAEQGIEINEDIRWDLLESDYEKKLSIKLAQYPAVLKLAAQKYDCSGLVSYLLEFAKEFNRFYRECPVLSAENDALKKARLAMCVCVRDVLVDGLKTLTISVPEFM
jgi:arginyl-tRNA synthetase